MPEDPKTIAIDTSAVLEKQRELSKNHSDVPRTVAIDGEQLAQRLAAARRERDAAPVPARRSPWIPVAIVVAIGVLAIYLVAT